MTDDPGRELSRTADHLGLRILPEVERKFVALLDLLVTSGSDLNLTAIRDPAIIVRRHFIESLAIGVEIGRRGLLIPGTNAIDLGSGAGFPGLPLKLAWPDLDIWLLEATGKKARFIQLAIDSLGLNGAHVLEGRAETLARVPQLREGFDLVLARAVVPLPALVELALPFLRLGGVLAATKGSRASAEIAEANAALRACGGELTEHLAAIEGASLGLVLVRKVAPTPERYPRRPGQPAAHPIGARG